MAKAESIGAHGQGAEMLLGAGQGLLSSLDEQKKQKQQMLLELIKAGAYQPSQAPAENGFLSRLKENFMGPNLASASPTMFGQSFTRVTPEMQANQLKQQMAAYGSILGPQGQGGMQPSFSIDPITGRMKSISMKPASRSQSPIGTLGDVTGKDPDQVMQELKQRDPGYATFLKNVYEGNIKMQGRGSVPMMQVQKDVGLLYPDFDQSKTDARFATRQDFTKGKAAQNIKALNTATDHLAALHDASDKLHNSNYPAWNAVANWGVSQVGDPRVNSFNTIKNAVVGELASIFKGSSGTDPEFANIAKTISSSNSPQMLQDSIKDAVKLMRGRMNSLRDQWKSAFGDNSEFNVVSPRAKKILERLAPEEDGDSGVSVGQTTQVGKYTLVQ